MNSWSPSSWKSFDYQQSAHYPDVSKLDWVVHELSNMPPLVTTGEIHQLKSVIARAGRGEAFMLQGGDCAELFSDCNEAFITNKLKILLQMSLILLYGLRKPIVRIGRIAGQFAKPRSSNTETINGITLPCYRGDLVNEPEFTEKARTPNPKLLLKGYNCAATTLNYIRALLTGGFADLNHPHQWDLEFVDHSKQAEEYHAIVQSISDSLDFLETIDGLRLSNLSKVDFYTSHEALHLHYEQALTRQTQNGLWYNLGTHFPWIGMRTASNNSAHVEYLRGIQNPIAIKIGPSMPMALLKSLISELNPQKEEGRLVLITRLGANQITDLLPSIIETVQKTRIPVTWSCDPMHGNTETTLEGIKTRHFDNILSELIQAVRIHQQQHSHLGGVHFELTGENVTECIGGARGLNTEDLTRAYHSRVDPRLNYEQSLEMAIQLGRVFKAT